jgi:hypothetical protein
MSLLIVAAAVLSIGLGGCGNLTGGGFAQVDVSVTGDHEPPPPSPFVAAMFAPAMFAPVGSPVLADEAEEAEGEVEIDFQLYLVGESGGERRLGEEELRAKVDVQGVTLDESVSGWPISAERYTELRIVFTKIQAEIEGGLVVDGVPIAGEVHVELEDVSLEVVRAIDLDVHDGEMVELILDLNAPAWLTAVDPLTRTVDETVFAALMNVVVSP